MPRPHCPRVSIRFAATILQTTRSEQESVRAGSKRYCAALLFLFPLSAAQEWQDEQISQDVDDTAGEYNQTKTLRWREIG